MKVTRRAFIATAAAVVVAPAARGLYRTDPVSSTRRPTRPPRLPPTFDAKILSYSITTPPPFEVTPRGAEPAWRTFIVSDGPLTIDMEVEGLIEFQDGLHTLNLPGGIRAQARMTAASYHSEHHDHVHRRDAFQSDEPGYITRIEWTAVSETRTVVEVS